jgi:dCTP deaminase
MTSNPLFPELAAGASEVVHSTGVLPHQKIEELIQSRAVLADPEIAADQVQPASIDLRLSSRCYRVQASFLPNRASTVMAKLSEMIERNEAIAIDLAKPTVLERGVVYIARLMEELRLPAEVSGKANPKSTTGRLDVLTRLITDYSAEFEKVRSGYRGPLYVEIFPSTFSILVREGTRLNQLRLLRGTPAPSDAKLSELHKADPLVYLEDRPGNATISKGLWLSVDLQGAGHEGIIGYRARPESVVVDFDQKDFYPPEVGWDRIPPSDRKQLLLEPNRFYLLACKERVRIPPTHAAEMIAYDPSFGEFRIHYAGFFDPGFGYGNDEVPGARAVLEVRSHNVPFLLEDGQIVGRLVFERLLCAPTRLYGESVGSSYQGQGLRLGKQFKMPTRDAAQSSR